MKLLTFISQYNLAEVEMNKSLKKLTSLKIGGVCKYYVIPYGVFELSKIIKFCYCNQIKYFVLGNCTNVLISDDYFDIVFISLKKINTFKNIENIYMLDAGLKSCSIGYKLIKEGYEEALPLALIPGTVGGIIYMNGSCFKRNINSILEKVVLITEKGNIVIKKKPFDFSYRKTCFHNDKIIIVKAIFKFKIKNINSISIFEKYLTMKKNNQPLNSFNAGSIFKNPNNQYAWQLIEDVGLRGFSIGDAEVSWKHTNFLINKKQASFNEMLALIYYTKYKVLYEKKVRLETEIKIITPHSI